MSNNGGGGGGGRKRKWKAERVKMGQGGTLDPLADGVLGMNQLIPSYLLSLAGYTLI